MLKNRVFHRKLVGLNDKTAPNNYVCIYEKRNIYAFQRY